ncbi:MAG: energy transducer TonB [Bacteroidota bacterium]|nr:energy transducer TonB [Bacteroidota bacterium]
MTIQEENNYPKAFLATGLIMAFLIALCYFIVFHNPPKQEDGMGGILVNYGTVDEGMGKDISSTEQPSVSPKANHTQPNRVTEQQPTEPKTQVDNSEKNVVTQNAEDAPVVAANSKKTSQSVATEPAKPVKKQVVNTNALYKGPSSTGAGGGDGTSNKPGNQGSPNGSPLSDNYGPGGTGGGLKGTQWSFVNPPNVKNVHRVAGRIVINVTIDQNGNIISADYDRKKTTNPDLELILKCEAAVKSAKLTSSAPAVGNQKSQIVFQFNID